MNARSRVVLALAITALLFGGMLAVTLYRIERWSEMGYAGVNYLQIVGPKQPRVFGKRESIRHTGDEIRHAARKRGDP